MTAPAGGPVRGEPIWLRHPRATLILFSLLIGLGSIAGKGVSYRDEVRVAGMAREMAIYGDLAVPHLNGKPFL